MRIYLCVGIAKIRQGQCYDPNQESFLAKVF